MPDTLSALAVPAPAFANLHGWRLALARVVWAGGAVFALALFVAYLPFNLAGVHDYWLFQSSAGVVTRYVPLDAFANYVLAVQYVIAAVAFGVAALIVWRKATDGVAWLVALGLLMLPTAFFAKSGSGGPIYALYGAPWHLWLPGLRDGLALFVFYYLAWLFFIFPNGRFEPRWMKAAMCGILALNGLLVSLAWLATGQVSWDVLSVTLILWWVPAVGSQIYRYWRVAGPLERQQTKWFVATVAFMPGWWLFGLVSLTPLLSEPESSFIHLHLQLAWFLWLPLGVGVGVLRRGLWGADPLINRTLVYGALTAFVIGAYIVGVGLAGRVLQTQEGAVVAILALMALVPVIPSLRRGLQRGANRLLPLPAVASHLPEATETKTRLRGVNLLLARLVWWGVALLAIGLLIMAVPPRFNQLLTVFPVVGTQVGQLNVAEARLLGQLGFSVSFYATYLTTLEVLVAVVNTLLAVFIFWRKSDDWMAWLVSLALITLPSATPLMTGLVESQPALQGAALFLRGLGIGPAFYIFYLFPSGRFVPHWTRWLALAWAGYTIAWLLFPALRPPLGLLRVETSTDMWLGLGWLGWTGVGVLAQLYRYHRVSNATERQQTQWIVFGFGATTLVLLVAALPNLLFPALRQPTVAHLVYLLAALTATLLSFLIVPLTVSIAILRQRLWEIEVILNRTLAYSALTTALIALYVIAVGALGVLFQMAGNAVLSILATGLIAILFNPLRQRLQRAVNRLMYGERDDPATALAQLGQRLEVALAPAAVLPTIVEAVAQALKAPYVALEVRGERANGLRVEWKANPASAVPADEALMTIPLMYQSETIGQLLVAPRAPGEVFSPADQRLLDTLARQAAPAVHAYRLTTDLQRSRERIVTAREEERRRIRRDLHDGLGPTLASQAFKLDAALDLLTTNPAAASRLLQDLKGQTQATVADIRRLVYELRPPALDELGLVGALRAHIENHVALANGLHLTFDAPPDLPALPAAVEVAAYRIVAEAITNVARHARARQCRVRLALTNNQLCLAVEDDGVGLVAPGRMGVGLTSMRERAAELGGRCVIENRPAGGTQVDAQLPLG